MRDQSQRIIVRRLIDPTNLQEACSAVAYKHVKKGFMKTGIKTCMNLSLLITWALLLAWVSGTACSFDPSGLGEVAQNNNNNEPSYICGNNVREPGEVCDGSDLAGETCESLGFEGGVLACLADCSWFDTSGCEGPGPVCGNNVREGTEVCDGSDLAGETCQTQGFYSGTLACLDDCSDFDASGCFGQCGDGIINGTEVCDGSALAGETCQTQGFYSGTLACLDDCSGFDTSGCSGQCGDGIINGNEECDGDDLGGMTTCEDFGCRSSGVVTCNPDCTYNISACLSGHDEDGDGIDDNCDNCPSYYNPGQEDNNNDGIGDVCEYREDHSLLSSIVVFDPFLEDASSWTPLGGTWTYGNDVVIGDSGTVTLNSNYLHDLILANEPYAVETTFYFDQPAYTGDGYTGLIFARHNLDFYVCTFNRSNNTLSIWRHVGGSGWVYNMFDFIDTTVQDSQWHKIHVFYDGSETTCIYLDEAGGAGSLTIPPVSQISDMSGQAGLRLYNGRAVFTSFVVYK